MDENTQGPETPATGFKGKGIGVEETSIAFRPKNWEELWNFAQLICKTDFVPKGLRDNPGGVLACIQTGHELGVGPMASLQNITPISGRPVIWGDLALALLKASPDFEYIKEVPPDQTLEKGGECTVKIRSEEAITRRFTPEMAKKAGLLTKEGPWQTYTGRQYQMRARAWAIRDAAPGVLRGIGIREEVQDIEIEATPEVRVPIALPQPKAGAEPQAEAEKKKRTTKKEATGEPNIQPQQAHQAPTDGDNLPPAGGTGIEEAQGGDQGPTGQEAEGQTLPVAPAHWTDTALPWDERLELYVAQAAYDELFVETETGLKLRPTNFFNVHLGRVKDMERQIELCGLVDRRKKAK